MNKLISRVNGHFNGKSGVQAKKLGKSVLKSVLGVGLEVREHADVSRNITLTLAIAGRPWKIEPCQNKNQNTPIFR